MIFREATLDDVTRLAHARWAFRTETNGEIPIQSEDEFVVRYDAFVRRGIISGEWTYFIAETDDDVLVSHMAVRIVDSIPRPSRAYDRWGYLTDCYTRAEFRSQGIGTSLLAHVAAWARSRDLEMLLVWPSDESQQFYARAGFERDDETRVLRLRDYDAPPAA